jgi:PAS domain S-box-containing protein
VKSTSPIEAEEALPESERRLKEIIDALPAAVYMTDAEGRLTHFNPAAARFSGRTPQIGTDQWCVTWKLYRPDGTPLPHDECPMAIALREGRAVESGEVIAERPDGTRIWFVPYPTPLRDGAGKVTGAINVLVDITDRKLAEEALNEANRRKDDFLAVLAHELRTPLAPIRNALEIMRRLELTDSRLERARSTMERQLGLMIRLVDDLMDASRIAGGKLELKPKRIQLASVVNHAVEASRPLADCARHTIEVTLPSEPICLFADPARLAQVFGNVLNNSCKYMEPGGRIQLTAKRQRGQVVVKIRDTGVGIPRDNLEQIFEKFVQVHRTLERSQGGIGLGLTLVRRLIELHGGTVEALSDGVGRGSEFVIRLPALSPDTVSTHPTQAARQAPSAKRRVLIVEDSADTSELLSLLLSMAGNETQIACDGLSAVELAGRFLPDVVLIDLGLPKLDGYQVCRRILEEPWGRNILMVAVTGWGQEEDRRKSREAGFDHHLVKPVDAAHLLELLAQASPARRQQVAGS